MKLMNIFAIEFVQNAPMIAAFIVSYWLFLKKKWLGVVIIITGAFGSAALIACTEAIKLSFTSLESAPCRLDSILKSALLLTVAFCGFAFVIVGYLYCNKKYWWVDPMIGAAAGVGLTLLQASWHPGLPLQQMIGHMLAFGLAGTAVPLITRTAGNRAIRQESWWPLLVGSLVNNTVMTLLVVTLEYLPFTD